MLGELVRRFSVSKAQGLESGLFELISLVDTAGSTITTCLFFVIEFLLQQPLPQNILKFPNKHVIRVKQADQRPYNVRLLGLFVFYQKSAEHTSPQLI